jgi:hypothetical protein
MNAARRFLTAHRRKLARLTALAGLLTVGLLLLPEVPRSLNVELELGQAHAGFVALRVSYLRSGEELQGVSFAFPDGAPLSVHHSITVAPGDLEVRAQAWRAAGPAVLGLARVHAPVEGGVHIHFPEPAP